MIALIQNMEALPMIMKPISYSDLKEWLVSNWYDLLLFTRSDVLDCKVDFATLLSQKGNEDGYHYANRDTSVVKGEGKTDYSTTNDGTY